MSDRMRLIPTRVEDEEEVAVVPLSEEVVEDDDICTGR